MKSHIAMRLAFVTSHPIQYYAPLFRALAHRVDLVVFFAHRATPSDQAKAGFGVEFEWDVALLFGYCHEFLHNVAIRPALDRFSGCDTPEIGERLRKGRFDAVLVQGWYLKCFLQAAFAAKRLSLPLIVRGDSQLDTPRSMLTRAAKSVVYPASLRLFDAALYVGERSRAYWRAMDIRPRGCSSRRIAWTQRGLRPARRRRLGPICARSGVSTRKQT
jgi:hypothetical protein